MRIISNDLIRLMLR